MLHTSYLPVKIPCRQIVSSQVDLNVIVPVPKLKCIEKLSGNLFIHSPASIDRPLPRVDADDDALTHIDASSTFIGLPA